VSGSTTFDIVVEDATGGVGAHTTKISIADPSVAGVTNVQLLGNPGQQTVDIAADNGSVTIDTGIIDTADTGPVTVARITLAGNASGATLTVTVVRAIGGFDNALTDPDSD
jgi:hypothetical protein